MSSFFKSKAVDRSLVWEIANSVDFVLLNTDFSFIIDMRLFGLCPAKDNLILAVCKECQKIVQSSMLAAHYGKWILRLMIMLARPFRVMTKLTFLCKGSFTKDVHAFLPVFNPPGSSCPRLSAFCLTVPSPCLYELLVGRNLKNCKNMNKIALEITCILYLFLLYLYTILYCTVLYCTVLYCTVLYCTVLYCTVLYCTVLYCTVLYCTVLYCTVLYCTILIFQSLTKEDDNMTFKYTLLIERDCAENDAQLQLNPLPPLSAFICTVANPLPPIRCGYP